MARISLRLAFGIALAAGTALAHAEVAGRVLLAAGDTFAVRDGKQVRLQFNSQVESKDVLRTGAASSLQVRFTDEGMISLRENSEFAIEEYRFSGKQDGNERGFFRLVRGGFRAVTGVIGHAQNANYKVQTQTATIGIRGTDYAVRDCRGDCGADVKDGLYGSVLGLSSGTNKVALENNTGERVFGINQSFFVPDANSPPQQLLQPPTFIAMRPQGRGQAALQGGGTGGERASGSSGAAAESRPSATTDIGLTTPVFTQPYQVTQDLGTSGTPTALPAANGFLAVYPFTGNPSGDLIFDEDVSTATFNGQNHLLSYGTLGTFPAGALAGGTITDTGSVTLANGQTFAWGRWTGDTQVTLNNGQTVTGVPVLFGTATGLQNSNTFVGNVGGTATYSFLGGPKPVDVAGNVGTIAISDLMIDFTHLTATYSISMNFPSVVVSGSNTGSAAFTLSGTGTKASSGAEFIGSLLGMCSGTGCGTGALVALGPGYASGTFGVGLTGTQGYEFAVVPGRFFGTQAGEVVFLNAYSANSYVPGPAPGGQLAGQVAWSNDSPSFIAGTWSLSTADTVYNGVGQPISFNQSISMAPSGTLGAGTIVEAGSTSLVDGGAMNWGRWSGGQITDPIYGTVTVASGVPFVVGNANTAVPTSGSFVYNLAGGPNVVTNTGVVGGPLTSGAFQVSFGTNQTISVASPLQFAVGGVSYSLGSCTSGCSTAGGNVVFGNMLLQGTCVGGACATSSPAAGNGAAFLVGPQAGGLAVAGNVFSPAAPVTFAAGFKR